jgi:hypothetical protein
MSTSKRKLICTIAFGLGLVAVFGVEAGDEKTDPWQAVQFMIGRWKGTAEGEAGAEFIDLAPLAIFCLNLYRPA